ncbi:MAG: peptide chain release factor N(5)-glutamine methyltransferase [Bacteroidaceae bacterium]|nr:peptide chain release factor N(5)-glutamine methyltransferase [Bacteroidaceae bacterium]
MKQLLEKIHQAIDTHYTKSEVSALARIIATELLAIPQTTFFLKDKITLTPEEEQKVTDALERLKKQEPIQYILGYSDFCGLRFAVNPSVLIPRPETSELVELIAAENPSARKILDIGTGSGCIAISLACKLPDAHITAWDISPQALAVAQKNSTTNGCNVLFEQRDILSFPPADKKFDIIVSNPPYIKECEKTAMEDNVLLWEPHLALFVPDNNPLLFYRAIAQKALTMLTRGGKLYFEINREHGNEIVSMMQEIGYKNITLRKDLAENDRMVSGEKP